MILDKLLEKKDILIYIDKRVEHLKKQKKKVVKNLPPKQRGIIVEKFNGRILELVLLKKHIDGIKKAAKQYWKDSIEKHSLEEIC